MASSFDDAVTTGIQKGRTIHEMLTDLLRAEMASREAASIRYRMKAAKLPAIEDLDNFEFTDTPINEGLVRSLYAGSFLPARRNIVAVGGTGTGKTHLALAITAAVVWRDNLDQKARQSGSESVIAMLLLCSCCLSLASVMFEVDCRGATACRCR
jgi:DNA replication protein DnaC